VKDLPVIKNVFASEDIQNYGCSLWIEQNWPCSKRDKEKKE
jgi:hypothetical protein